MADATDHPSAQPQAVEESPFPNDSAAQTGASMGDHCVTDRPIYSGVISTGEITKISEIDVYITKPNDYPHSPSKLLLFLSSGSGIHSLNNQLQADRFATEGFLVVMPDQFGGDPCPNSNDVNAYREENPTMIEQFKLYAAEAVQSFMIDMWLARQTPEKVMPLLAKVIDGIKEEFADAIANGGGIYAVGYCFGGKYVLELGAGSSKAGKDEEEGTVKTEPVIKAGALAHGTSITLKDLQEVTVPISMVCCENDPLFPDEIRIAGEKHFAEKGITNEVKVYPSVPHGFGVAGEYADPKIQEAQQTAFEQMLTWLKEH